MTEKQYLIVPPEIRPFCITPENGVIVTIETLEELLEFFETYNPDTFFAIAFPEQIVEFEARRAAIARIDFSLLRFLKDRKLAYALWSYKHSYCSTLQHSGMGYGFFSKKPLPDKLKEDL